MYKSMQIGRRHNLLRRNDKLVSCHLGRQSTVMMVLFDDNFERFRPCKFPRKFALKPVGKAKARSRNFVEFCGEIMRNCPRNNQKWLIFLTRNSLHLSRPGAYVHTHQAAKSQIFAKL